MDYKDLILLMHMLNRICASNPILPMILLTCAKLVICKTGAQVPKKLPIGNSNPVGCRDLPFVVTPNNMRTVVMMILH